jgi:hypothetical protein
MLKTFRELQRLAEREGMTKVKIQGGSPHGRLTGVLDGREIEFPVSMGTRLNPRGLRFMRMNIRHKRREMEGRA